jgi:hypothetical protein
VGASVDASTILLCIDGLPEKVLRAIKV